MKKKLAPLLIIVLISMPFVGLMDLSATFYEDPGTGYAWSYSGSNENVLVLESSVYNPDAYPSAAEGHRGGRTWEFKNGVDGDTVLKFTYASTEHPKPLSYTHYLYSVEKGLLQHRGDCRVYRQYAEIDLPENPTTGHTWRIDSDNTDILTLEKDTFRDYIVSEGFPYEGGVHRWQFVPKTPGEVAITFTNAQQNNSDADTLVFVFRVDQDLLITPVSHDSNS